MDDFGAIRSDVLEVLARAGESAESEGARATAASLRGAREALEDERLLVVVLGEFKAGKSSLLNALLDESGDVPLLPEAEEIATSCAVSVSYGDPEVIEVLRSAGKGSGQAAGAAGDDAQAGAAGPVGPASVVVDREGLRAQGTEGGNPENRLGVVAVEIETPAALLRPGVTLVDTPGLGGPHLQHDAATLAALPGADAVMLVCDSSQTLLRSHLDNVRRASSAVGATDHPDALFFALTKTDQAGFGEMLADMRAKLAKETGRAPEDLVVVPVSARAHRDFLRFGEDADRIAGNMHALRDGMWAALSHRGVPRVLGPALETLDRGVRALLEPVEGRIQALDETTRKTVEELRAEAVERQNRLAALKKGRAEWRTALRKRVEVLHADLHADALERHAQVWDWLESHYLEEDAYLTAPERLVQRLTADAAQVVAEVNARAAVGTAAVLAVTVAETGLPLGAVRPTVMPAPTDGDLTIERRLGEQHRSGRLKRRLRDLSFGGSMGSTTGAVLGSVVPGVGTAVGAALGGLAGMVAGWRSAARDERQEDRRLDRQSLRTQLRPLQRNQSNHITKAVKDISREFGEQAEKEMELRIVQEEETNRRLVEGLRKTEQSTSREAAAELSALRARRKPLLGLQKECAGLEERMRIFRATAATRPFLADGDRAPDQGGGADPGGPNGTGGAAEDNSWADE
ncbi:dynamin family protein [Streptomyces sp. NPDC093224]|uniref:dynamin family protein n=1 Tax=Streptomyces sp. NPDC093224 TaxID=3155198 RepID=UPI0034432712